MVCKNRIDILSGTLLGGGCRIYDMDFHQLDPVQRLTNTGPVPSAPIRIGPRAFLGGHVTVLKGVTIGEGAVIGAGSVATRDIPDFEVWAGVPAKRIRALSRNSDVRMDLENEGCPSCASR
jgi:acetyltransferase-like isoleucine patch superfamily enzyme